VREVSHGGATGGYRAVLQRYPDHGLSVAVLCNADNANAGGLGHEVAEVFLEGRLASEPARTPATLPADVLNARAGLYRDPRTMTVLKLDVVDGAMKLNGRTTLLPDDENVFRFEPFPSIRLEFQRDATGAVTGLRWIDADGPQPFDRVPPAEITAELRRGYAGRFVAPEAEATVTSAVDGESLVARQGPDWTGRLMPADRDVFTIPGTGTLAFDRARNGAVTGFRFYSGRVRGLRFDRQQEARR
jgi:hypothetical protein